MLREYNPKFKPVPAPLIGFDCIASGGADVRVYHVNNSNKIKLVVEGMPSTCEREDLIEFINKVIEVVENTKEGDK